MLSTSNLIQKQIWLGRTMDKHKKIQKKKIGWIPKNSLWNQQNGANSTIPKHFLVVLETLYEGKATWNSEQGLSKLTFRLSNLDNFVLVKISQIFTVWKKTILCITFDNGQSDKGSKLLTL